MKRIFITAFAAIVMAGTAVAQLPIKKGNYFANANVTEFDVTFGGGTDFTLGAAGGYFVADNLAILGGLSVYAWKDGDASTNAFGVNAGARYYFLEQGKGSFFASGLIGVDKIKDIDAAFKMTLNAGYAYFLNENVSVEPLVTLGLPFSSDYDITFSIGGAISVYF